MLDDEYAGNKFKHVTLTIKLCCLDVHVHKLFPSPHTGGELVPPVSSCLFFLIRNRSTEGTDNRTIATTDSQPLG